MARRPILPASMARACFQEVEGFVKALISARKTDTTEAILQCLFRDDPMLKGPFIDLRLPYMSASSASWPLDPALKQAFDPYAHQLEAYKRLGTKEPQHTIVTTGTGSGKSECFILPILNYVLQCKRAGKMSGVKALIIYPMNALIDDQAERLCELAAKLNDNLPKNSAIRIGRYTGGGGKVKEHSASNRKAVIDDREALCENPPDVLLTNYRMLDFMLFRPEEQKFWKKETKDVFRYLVLDELHTFDGAQGADVASLIRRVRLKLGVDFTCVGTSATVATSSGDPVSERVALEQLCRFSSTLFGTDIGKDAVIRQQHVAESDYLTADTRLTYPPSVPSTPMDLMLPREGAYEEYLEACCKRWGAPSDPVQRGEWIRSHPLTVQLVTLPTKGKALPEIAQSLEIEIGDLEEFLDLLATARVASGSRLAPVFPLQMQVWVSETDFLMRRLSNVPGFRRIHEDEDLADSRGYLPAVHCRNCGLAGWLTDLKEYRGDDKIQRPEFNRRLLIHKFFQNEGVVLFPIEAKKTSESAGRIVYYEEAQELLHLDPPDNPENYLKLGCAFLSYGSQKQIIKKKKHKGSAENLTACPACDRKLSLGLTRVTGSMLGSILSGVFLSHAGNPDDKKHLIFNDSVQDAAHQAGYLGARSYRFNVRRLLLQMAEEVRGTRVADRIPFSALETALKQHVSVVWDAAKKNDRDSRRELFRIVPKELWDLWHDRDESNPLGSQRHRDELYERLKWEFWCELTLQSDLGWSLKKTDRLALKLKPEVRQEWGTIAKNCAIKTQFGDLMDPEGFSEGFADRLIHEGAIYFDGLKDAYQQAKYSLWIYRKRAHLSGIFVGKFPKIVNLDPETAPGQSLGINLYSKQGRSWFQAWAGKNRDLEDRGSSSHTVEFLNDFAQRLLDIGNGLVEIKSGSKQVVIKDSCFDISFESENLYQCDICQDIRRFPGDRTLMCLHYRCTGDLKKLGPDEGQNHRNFTEYLSHHYARKIEPIFAHAHTGSLDSDDRRKVEAAFKRNLLPGDSMADDGKGPPYYDDHPINILACTPTLEMGIDIGSLSGVTLRGFPRSQASALQRLGRAGRSSGNALNLILTRRNAHDLFYWRQPEHFFFGVVTPPGCEFRTPDILLRQFHAYLLDLYASSRDDLKLPKLQDLDDKTRFVDHPYWQGFRDFLARMPAQKKGKLDHPTTKAAEDFVRSVAVGGTSSMDMPAIMKHLSESISSGRYWQDIEQVLQTQDLRREQLRAAEAKVEKTKLKSHTSGKKDEEDEKDRERLQKARQKANLHHRVEKSSTSEYTLSLLADQGILPNYAFPEQGITLNGTIQVPQAHTSGKTSGSRGSKTSEFKELTRTIVRPPAVGLRELAPGSVFYTDGFKLPIIRVSKPADAQELLSFKIVCDQCGTVSDAPMTAKDLQVAACPVCDAADRPVHRVLEFREVESEGDYGQLQIRDGEEDRESSRLQVETWINYQTKSSDDRHLSKHATWISNQEKLAFEFRTNARINLLVRGEKKDDVHELFSLCAECWASPFRQTEEDGWVFKEGDTNRHGVDCSHYFSPNNHNIPIERVALGRTIRSDTIRFAAGMRELELTPTLQAVMNRAMNLLVEGSPDHISTLTSQLSTPFGTQLVVTLYDTVPGGTGHLRGLMPLSDNSFVTDRKMPSKLFELFMRTLHFLKDCPCEKGCYRCLLSYINRFQHELISKSKAIKWLTSFVRTEDWEVNGRSLSQEIVTNRAFDNYAEHQFIHGLKNQDPGILGVKRAKSSWNGSSEVITLEILSNQEELQIFNTNEEKVYLKGDIPYTKPDFTIIRNGQPQGYIYIDGASVHLSPKEAISTFEKIDVEVRTSLLQRLGVGNDRFSPVLTISADIVSLWCKWLEERSQKEFSQEHHRSSQKVNGQAIPTLIVLLSKIFAEGANIPFKTEDLFKDLSISYVHQGLGSLLCESSYLSEKDRKLLDSVMKKALKDGQRFGGLSFRLEPEPHFEFDPSADFRLSSTGEVDGTFEKSWELFWILWAIDRNLVTVIFHVKSKTSHAEKGKNLSGIEYLKPKSMLDLFHGLTAADIGPSSILDETDCHPDLLRIFGRAPELFLGGSYAIYADLDTSQIEEVIPSQLQDGTQILLVDPERLHIQDIISMLSPKKKDS
jgi:DEAD/DEAH box helicase domain-containing protein